MSRRFAIVGILAVIAICVDFWRAPSARAAADAQATERALALAEARWSAQGAVGVYRDSLTDTFVVDVPAQAAHGFRLGSTGELELPVSVRTVAFNQHDIDVAHDRLSSLTRHMGIGHGSAIFFFDPAQARIYVSTTLPQAAVEASLGDRAYLLDYHVGGLSLSIGRCADTPPFWGGAALEQCGPAYCTTGFTVIVNSSGARTLTTAGHCYLNIQQARTPTGTLVGTILNRHCAGQTDAEEITGNSYGHYIYIGGSTGSGIPVTGSADPTAGSSIWESGANSTETQVVVVSTSASGTDNECGSFTNMFTFRVPGGSCPIVGGDSGGPVYAKSGSTVSARGLIKGYSTDHSICLATKWSSVASGLGVSIATN